jgi:hypothetical protein
MPYRVRGKEVQVLLPVGWMTLKVYGSRKLAEKHLMAFRSHAKAVPPRKQSDTWRLFVKVGHPDETAETPDPPARERIRRDPVSSVMAFRIR